MRLRIFASQVLVGDRILETPNDGDLSHRMMTIVSLIGRFGRWGVADSEGQTTWWVGPSHVVLVERPDKFVDNEWGEVGL